MHGKPFFVLLLACAFALFLSFVVVGADSTGDVQGEASQGESSDPVYEESSYGNEENSSETDSGAEGEISVLEDGGESGQQGEVIENSNDSPDSLDRDNDGDSVTGSDSSTEGDSVGHIDDDYYRSRVLAFLLFFTVVIVAYFGYKFFAMFF